MTQKLDIGNFSAGEVGKQLNIGLLGFKMAVNDSITVFNLVDGVVDEFHDESGTDEGEGSNDTYCSTSDNYLNFTCGTSYVAGFSTTLVTEADTSTAGTNPDDASGTSGTFTVPSGITSVDIRAFGSGGGGFNNGSGSKSRGGAGGGLIGFSGGQTAAFTEEGSSQTAGGGGQSSGGEGGGGTTNSTAVGKLYEGGDSIGYH